MKFILSRFNLPLTVFISLIAPLQSLAQFAQQGGRLVGTGAVGAANQGYSVSMSADGNTAIIGGASDNGNLGAAWIWTRTNGTWTQQGNKLVGTGVVGGAADQGYSVALSADGNTAIIGGYADNGNVGAAWVWTRSNGTWTQQGNKLVGTGTAGSSYQGYSVSLSADGNTAIIGGVLDNGNMGAAWVWTRSAGTWTQQGSKLVGTGAVGMAFQGNSVSLSSDGNTAIIGGRIDNNFIGAAWVWTRSNGTWTQQGNKLVGTGTAGSQFQGASVSISSDGNTALVGGYGDNSNVGAAWVWTRSAGTWTQQGNKLVGTGAVGNAQQGTSVALSSDGNIAFVGGYADNTNAGAAWVWTRSAGAWTQQGNKLVGMGAVGASFQGVAVALSGDGNNAIVGGYTDNSATGAAWVYIRPPATPTLNSPENNSTSVPVSGNLTWNPSNRAATYRVQLSTDSTFATTMINDSTIAGTSRSVGNLPGSTVYYWRVNAKNIAGTSPFSATWKFTTLSAPSAPTLIAPIQNATILSVSANLTWNASVNATTYRVQVSTNPSFTTTLLNDSALTTTSRVFNSLTGNTVYYWRVNAKNASGTSDYSTTWTFNTNSTGLFPEKSASRRFNLENDKSLGFDLPKKEHVVIQIFNSQGRLVSRLLDETRDAGYFSIPLSNVANGTCYIDFRAGDYHKTILIQR